MSCLYICKHSLWKEKPWCDRLLKICRTVMRHIYLHLFGHLFYIPERIDKLSKNTVFSLTMHYLIEVYLCWGGVTPGQFQHPSITVSLLPVINLRPLREQLEQRKLHQVSAEKAIWRNAVIDFMRPSGVTPLSFSTSYSQIEVMSVWDEWSDTTSCSRNVELMNRTNFHQIKIHLHEAQVHLADTFP